MKKKILTILLTTSFMLSACNSQSSSAAPKTTVPESSIETSESAETLSENQSDESAPFDFVGDKIKLSYIKHETVTDYKGNQCLVIYYSYTNTGDKSNAADFTVNMQAYQNGIQCSSAIPKETDDNWMNSSKNIQPGATIEVMRAFEISDMSDVTLEVSELLSKSKDKATQVISLK